MKYSFSPEQLEYLIASVEFRVNDETAEVDDLEKCHRDEWLPKARHRLEVWKSILSELTKEA